MNIKQIGVAAAAVGLFAVTLSTPVKAENTLTKIGQSIQYTSRKDTENLSQDTHRLVHAKSVHHNRTGVNAHTRYVLYPNGYKARIYHHHHHHHTM